MSLVGTPSSIAESPNDPIIGWRRASPRMLGLMLGIMAICVVAMMSLRLGSLELSTTDAWNGLFHYSADSYEQTVVRKLRLPRTIIALAVGGALGPALRRQPTR